MLRHEKFPAVPLEKREIHNKTDSQSLRRGCQFIRKIGDKIGFPNRTVLTAQLYFRKFYQTRPLLSAPFLDIALTCTILASKVEESFEKIKQVLATAFLILQGDSFKGRIEDIIITDDHKNRVIQYERDVLIATEFRFNIIHAHEYLIKLSKEFGIDKESTRKAWEALNTIYESDDCVLWEPPHSLALAVLRPSAPKMVEDFCKSQGGLKLVEIKHIL